MEEDDEDEDEDEGDEDEGDEDEGDEDEAETCGSIDVVGRRAREKAAGRAESGGGERGWSARRGLAWPSGKAGSTTAGSQPAKDSLPRTRRRSSSSAAAEASRAVGDAERSGRLRVGRAQGLGMAWDAGHDALCSASLAWLVDEGVGALHGRWAGFRSCARVCGGYFVCCAAPSWYLRPICGLSNRYTCRHDDTSLARLGTFKVLTGLPAPNQQRTAHDVQSSCENRF
ncbi:hypothetical protein CDD83_7883 [Cordyceps sp. RAO-2017]|nr:hypothetical protein CDD83_7883 [Cordyceps sp. RAO-2017]